MGGGVMEVDCYCEHYLETISINVDEIFNEESSNNTIKQIRDNNRIRLYGNSEVIINMDLVTVVEVKSDMLIFHFVNGTKIVVHKNGDIEYLTNNTSQSIILNKEL